MTDEQQTAFDAWRNACRAFEAAKDACITARNAADQADRDFDAAAEAEERAGKARRLAREAFEQLLGASDD